MAREGRPGVVGVRVRWKFDTARTGTRKKEDLKGRGRTFRGTRKRGELDVHREGTS